MASTMSRVLRTGLALMLIVPLPELPTLLELEKTGVTCHSSEHVFVTGGPGRRFLAGPPFWFRSGSFSPRFAQLPLVAGLVTMRSAGTVAYVA